MPDPLTDSYARGKDELSQAAFDSIQNRSEMQRDVYRYLLQHGGATTDEVEVGLAGRHQSISPRIIELERAGLIRRSGEKRKTRSGRLAHVYILADPTPLPTTEVNRG